jgi:hypothetical protein
MVTLYRGFEEGCEPGEYDNPYLDKPRYPRDTPKHIHDFADSWFESQFHIRARSRTLICSTYIDQAAFYGTLTIIEPIQPYVLIYSPIVNDLFDKMKEDKLNMSETNRISKKDIDKYLDIQQYKMVHSSEDIDPSFHGEVHLSCLRYGRTVI